MIIFTLSGPNFVQVMYYLHEIDHNENINKEVIYAYCKMNSSSCIIVDGDETITNMNSEAICFDMTEKLKVMCINIDGGRV